MPNNFFKFKQFTIYQDKCAMKVCTDACLFGSWVAEHFEKDQPPHILDIGAGTGLLSLMLAQKLNGSIEAVEIDHPACRQASDNISKSKWKERITVINGDIKQFHCRHSYNLIVSNPPFYENDLRAAKQTDNIARHNETLTLEALLTVVSFLISADGSFAALVPYHRLANFISAAAHFNLYPNIISHVKPSSIHNRFRSMIIIKMHCSSNVYINEISIKEGQHYTSDFTRLLRDYYLSI